MATQKDILKQRKMQGYQVGIYDNYKRATQGDSQVIRLVFPKYVMDMLEIHTFFNPVTYVC